MTQYNVKETLSRTNKLMILTAWAACIIIILTERGLFLFICAMCGCRFYLSLCVWPTPLHLRNWYQHALKDLFTLPRLAVITLA
jgi:hypothetical protein